MNPVSLSDLAVDAVAQFHEARLDPEAVRLLQTLGFTKAIRVRLCKAGEPCIVQVRSTRIGLSSEVARNIFVIPEAPHAR